MYVYVCIFDIKQNINNDKRQSISELIKQRRRSSVRAPMTKELIQKESFLGVVLKPVVRDQQNCEAPQQAKQLLKVPT